MKCPKCDTEMVETESWGLRQHVCPKCGASLPATAPSQVSPKTGKIEKPEGDSKS
ncbi:zf-TFIIB domain-containing protein [Chloroflexota bacterium]